MDHKQAVTARARELFADKMDEVLRLAKHDCDLIGGGHEPRHFGGVLRRTPIVHEAPERPETAVAVAERETELDEAEMLWPQPREELGQILRSSVKALEKLMAYGYVADAAWTKDELLGLEFCVLLYGRPAILLSDERLAELAPIWNRLELQRDGIELAQRGVGRIELLGHPEYDWAGTGFLVGETTLMTTRRVVEIFAERLGDGHWEFRPGVSAWLDNRAHALHPISAGCRIEQVLGVDDHYDLALLRVEKPVPTVSAPLPLTIAACAPEPLVGRDVYLVSYPVRDSRQTEPGLIGRIFRDVYDVKRIHPGCIREEFQFRDVHLFRHDCGMLGNTRGGAIFDLQTHEILGLQVAGRYLEPGTAIPLWKLRDCPFMQRVGVVFGEASRHEMDTLRGAVERIARTRYWTRLRTVVNDILQQACREEEGG